MIRSFWADWSISSMIDFELSCSLISNMSGATKLATEVMIRFTWPITCWHLRAKRTLFLSLGQFSYVTFKNSSKFWQTELTEVISSRQSDLRTFVDQKVSKSVSESTQRLPLAKSASVLYRGRHFCLIFRAKSFELWPFKNVVEPSSPLPAPHMSTNRYYFRFYTAQSRNSRKRNICFSKT